MQTRNNIVERQRGYSLIEALISVAILGALSAALAPIIYSSIRLAKSTAASSRALETERTGDKVLKELFDSHIRLDMKTPSFVGDPGAIRLLVVSEGGRDPHYADLEIRDDILFLTFAPLEPNRTPPMPVADPVFLLDGVLSFEFYDNELESTGWRSRWREGAPPQLVAVNLANHSTKLPRQKIYPIKSRAPLNCVFDNIGNECRE